MAVFFTSDTHFGDWRALRIDRRPFPSLAAHDEALVALWNETVQPSDEVWHLGDFALGPGPDRIAELLSSLAGTKHLIVGNNDGSATLKSSAWATVQHYAEIETEGRHLILFHYPLRTWNKMGRGTINLHGHSHGWLKPLPRQYDVGVDAWEYRPVMLERILATRRRRAAAPARRLRESNG